MISRLDKQRSLFGGFELPKHCTAPSQSHSPTSRAAASLVTPHLGAMQQRVLDWLSANGPATDNEIIRGVGGNPNGPRARRIELFRAGLIEKCGEKSGSTIWRAK